MLRIKLGGFKEITRRAAKTIFPLQKIERWGFDPELLYLARKFGFKVVEVPVEWAHSEDTRISPSQDGNRMFGEMLHEEIQSLISGLSGGISNGLHKINCADFSVALMVGLGSAGPRVQCRRIRRMHTNRRIFLELLGDVQLLATMPRHCVRVGSWHGS